MPAQQKQAKPEIWWIIIGQFIVTTGILRHSLNLVGFGVIMISTALIFWIEG